MVWKFLLVAFAKRMRSLAKKSCEKMGPSLAVLTPFQFSCAILVWMRQARYSMQRMKMYGERGSPYRIPREGWKGSSLSPLTRTERFKVEMQDMIISIQALGNLNQLRTWWINPHSSLSKAFSKSILSAINLCLPLELVMEWMTS